MPKKMSLLHRIFWGAIEKEAPGKLEELGKPLVEKEIASLKAKHSPEQYAHMLKTAYNGFMIFDKGVRDSPTEFDDAGLDIFLDPIREAAARDGIEL